MTLTEVSVCVCVKMLELQLGVHLFAVMALAFVGIIWLIQWSTVKKRKH